MNAFGELEEGNATPFIQLIEDELRIRYEDRPRVIESWYESTFRLFCVIVFDNHAPEGWSIEEEKSSPNKKSIADLLIKTPSGKRIVIELKYVANKNVWYENRYEDQWFEHIDNGHQHILDTEDLSTLKMYPVHSKKPKKVTRHVISKEFTPGDKRPNGKFEATLAALNADDGFVVVGMGCRAFIFKHKSLDEVLAEEEGDC